VFGNVPRGNVSVEGWTPRPRLRVSASASTRLSLAFCCGRFWDPIGADVPIDEYESYVPAIWKLLDGHAGVEAVSRALAQIADERIGLDRGTSRSAAERLTQWWYWRFDFPAEFEANS